MDLHEIAVQLDRQLVLNRREKITDENALDVQALCIGEEAGELIGAYRRYTGRARRTGSRADVEQEIADVIIVTAVFAVRFGVNVNEVIENKLGIVYSRGWEEEPAEE